MNTKSHNWNYKPETIADQGDAFYRGSPDKPG